MKLLSVRFLLLQIFTLCITTGSFSQGNTGYLFGGGIMYYNGDLSDKANTVFANPVFIHPYATVGVTHWLSGHIESSLLLVHGKVSGADSVSKEKNNVSRNLSFVSAIDEASLRFEFNSLHRYEKSRLNAFVFTGVSVYHFNPKAKFNDAWYALQPLGTEGQYIENGNYPKPYKLVQVAIPAGFGLMCQLSRYWRLKAEFNHRILFTDYLDDVSTNYPDYEALLASPGGALAASLSGRRINGQYPAADSPRGGAKHKDAYTSIGLSLIYNPGISHCPASFSHTKIKRNRR